MDVSFYWKIDESTTVHDLYRKINRKMEKALTKGWEEVTENKLVKAENSLRAVLQSSLLRDLCPELFRPNKDKNTLDLSKYNDKLDQNLWDLVGEKWRYENPSALRLDVVLPNRVVLGKKLGGEPPQHRHKNGHGLKRLSIMVHLAGKRVEFG